MAYLYKLVIGVVLVLPIAMGHSQGHSQIIYIFDIVVMLGNALQCIRHLRYLRTPIYGLLFNFIIYIYIYKFIHMFIIVNIILYLYKLMRQIFYHHTIINGLKIIM